MSLVTYETTEFETNPNPLVEGFCVLEEHLPPADDAPFPAEAAAAEPATETRTTRDYFAIQVGLLAKGVRIDEGARQQITTDYTTELSYAAFGAYKNKVKRADQTTAFRSALDFICNELEDIKQGVIAGNEHGDLDHPMPTIYNLGSKYFREQSLYGLSQQEVAVILRDVSRTGTGLLFRQAAAFCRSTAEPEEQTVPAISETAPVLQKRNVLAAARTVLRSLITS